MRASNTYQDIRRQRSVARFPESALCPNLLDAAGGVGEVEPDFDAAEVRTFSADGRGNPGSKMAGRADVAREFGMDFAKLCYFVHRSLKNFFLGIKAGAHGPFVEKMEERARFVEANGFGVGENVKRNLERHTPIEKLTLSGPGVVHGAFVSFLGPRIRGQKHGRDVIRFARVGEREQRARAGDRKSTRL